MPPPRLEPQDRRSLARLDRGEGRRRTRPARPQLEDQRALRRHRPRPARLPRHGRRARQRGRRGRGRVRGPARARTSAGRRRSRRERRRRQSPRTSRRASRGRARPARARPPRPTPTRRWTIPTGRTPARPAEALAADAPFSNLPPVVDYKAFTTRFDETVKAEDLCDAAELDRLRAYLDKQLAHLQGAVGRLANRLQRRLMAQQNRAWDFDLEEGMLDAGAAVARHHRPDASAVLQGRARHRVPRHRRDAAARQFRLDARPADHGRGDLRRHPRPHARALRRQGRDPRLHHARLEGRPVARGLAAGRQARQSRPAQRPPPHHLQGGRRALAARAPQSRPDDARGAPQGEHRRRGAGLGASAGCSRAPSSARS